MAVAELSGHVYLYASSAFANSHSGSFLPSKLLRSSSSFSLSSASQCNKPFQLRHPLRLVCSTSQNQVQAESASAPVAVPPSLNGRPNSDASECYGVFCLTYDLKADEETRAWKKLIRVAVSGAAGMISNHLLFQVHHRHIFLHLSQRTASWLTAIYLKRIYF